MADWEEQVERMQADGRITPQDADEVRTFASFLQAIQGIPTASDRRTPEQSKAWIEAYKEHYPEDHAQDLAEQQARQEKADG